MTLALTRLCMARGVVVTPHPIPPELRVTDDESISQRAALAWVVHLANGTRTLRTRYWTGPGCRGMRLGSSRCAVPSDGDVLASLFAESKSCTVTEARLREFLGDHFDEFLVAFVTPTMEQELTVEKLLAHLLNEHTITIDLRSGDMYRVTICRIGRAGAHSYVGKTLLGPLSRAWAGEPPDGVA